MANFTTKSLALFSPSRSPFAILSSAVSRFKLLQPPSQIRTFKPFRKANLLNEDFGININDSSMPPYPYAARQAFKQADRGLYGGAQLQFGNKISKGRNKGKTRRRWYPNVRLETIRSEALGREVTIRITASCMRTIRKCGGLDQYLLGDKPARIKDLGLFGWRLRWKVLNSPMIMNKHSAERLELGLDPRPYTEKSFESDWENEEVKAEAMREQKQAWESLKAKEEKFSQHVQTKWEQRDKREYHPVAIVPDPKSVPSLADR